MNLKIKKEIKEREDFWVGEEIKVVPEKSFHKNKKSLCSLVWQLHFFTRCLKVQKMLLVSKKGRGVSPPEAALVVSELKCPDAASLLQSAED